MNKIISLSAVMVIPWVVILLANLEKQVFGLLQGIAAYSNLVILILLLLPFALLLLRWLVGPTKKPKSRGLDHFIKFSK